MDNHKILSIIFDLGNVLIDFDHTIAAKRIAHFCQKSPEEIFKLFFNSEITNLFEEGKILPGEFFLKVKEILSLRLSYEAFVPIWDDIFFLTSKNRAVFSLANTLRNKYKIAVLSNINILHFEYLKKYFSIFSIFHNVFVSFEMGAIKPQPESYKKVIKELEVAAENIFYTDDRKELVESASRLGIKSKLFTTIHQLKKDLLDAGVNIP